jgi:N-acetylmuramoyl-L-alanine amidase
MSQQTQDDRHVSGSAPAGHVMRHIAIMLVAAAAFATVFTAWTPASLSPGELAGQLAKALERNPSAISTQEAALVQPGEGGELKIGVVVGHAGPHPETGYIDPGSTCEDGLTELEVNQRIAELVVRALEAAGLQVDQLDEWDERLFEYRAVALVSIHADSCLPINELATGYKVTTAVDTIVEDKAQRLVACLVDRYGRATGLPFHPGSITRDMTEYHTFKEIHSQTPAVIIETGFLYLDRALLTENPEKAARGIAEGLLCYVNNEPADFNWEAQP